MLLSLYLEDQEEFLHLLNLLGSRIILCICRNMSILCEDTNPISFYEAISNSNHLQWMIVMEDELASLSKNGVWDLVELHVGCKFVG